MMLRKMLRSYQIFDCVANILFKAMRSVVTSILRVVLVKFFATQSLKLQPFELVDVRC